MFKFVFEFLTDPLGLPIPYIYEYIILAVIGFFAYVISYNLVGKLYNNDLIAGKMLGKIFHWSIRIVVFVILWAISYGVIKLFFFAKENLEITLVLLFVSVFVLFAIGLIIKHNKVHKRILHQQTGEGTNE